MLNRHENYKVLLIPLASEKKIGCSGQYCTEILKVASPDDEHTEVSLEKPKEENCIGSVIEREYKCSRKHITKVYWYQPKPFIGAV
jgi:hypothetical protein